jgi:putative transposase
MRNKKELISPCSKELSIRRQCQLLDVSRTSLYYESKGEKPENLEMMKIMDKHLLCHPTEGVIYGISAEQSGICSWP